MKGAAGGFFSLLLISASVYAAPRVIVLGFDGVDPDLVERFIGEGKLPHLTRLRDQGTFSPLATTRPAESPVAWASFATGMNPGKTRIFDFLYRRPGTYFPGISLAEETTEPFFPETSLRIGVGVGAGIVAGLFLYFLLGLILSRRWASGVAIALGLSISSASLVTIFRWLPREIPKPVGRRGGVPFWNITSANGIKTVALEAPVTFPAEDMPGGKLLTGLGTPDLRKTWGYWTLYTTDLLDEDESEMGGTLIPLVFEEGRASATIRGPQNFTVEDKRDVRVPILFDRLLDHRGPAVRIEAQGRSFTLQPGEWSDWIELRFPLNPLVALHGMTRFCLISLEPRVRVYMEPLNWNPRRLPPTVAISYPRTYARELADAVGLYETIGWSTATNPLRDEALGYDDFLADVRFAAQNQRRMLLHELRQKDWRCLVAVFLFTDRVQHMLWRFVDAEHPLYDASLAQKYAGEIEKAYALMDDIVGEVMQAHVDSETFLFVISDHGFHSFRKGVNLNTWLVDRGYMTLKGAAGPRKLQDLSSSETLFNNVDWTRTKAYALGLTGIFLNVAGREPQGIVAPGAEYEAVRSQIMEDLTRLTDPGSGQRIVRSLHRREEIFRGPFTEEAYDIEVGFESGYRTSWQSTIGGIPKDVIELNRNNWSGDHCSVDSDITEGVFFFNRKPLTRAPRIIDIAPTVLKILGVPIPGDMDGEPIQ